MATTAATTSPLKLKLLIDTKNQRVLFAEAGKDVVDFLFSLLALPIATADKLIGTAAMAGSVGNLYASVYKLDATYVQPGAAKDALLRPPAVIANISLLPAPAQPKAFFMCIFQCGSYVTDARGTSCPVCKDPMTKQLNYAKPCTGAGKGFVQAVATYTVTDDLTVAPMSAISSIAMLNTFGVRDLADLQEKTVQISYDEGREILKASLQSTTVLTDVFLGNNA